MANQPVIRRWPVLFSSDLPQMNGNHAPQPLDPRSQLLIASHAAPRAITVPPTYRDCQSMRSDGRQCSLRACNISSKMLTWRVLHCARRTKTGSSGRSRPSCRPDRKLHQNNQKNQIDQKDQPTKQTSRARSVSTGDRSGRPPSPSGISPLPSGISPHLSDRRSYLVVRRSQAINCLTHCYPSLFHPHYHHLRARHNPCDIPSYNGDASLYPLDRR